LLIVDFWPIAEVDPAMWEISKSRLRLNDLFPLRVRVLLWFTSQIGLFSSLWLPFIYFFYFSTKKKAKQNQKNDSVMDIGGNKIN
jgi:hypothetical protein